MIEGTREERKGGKGMNEGKLQRVEKAWLRLERCSFPSPTPIPIWDRDGGGHGG